MIPTKHIRLLLAAGLLSSMLLTLAITCNFGTGGGPVKAQGERQLENLMPKHIPLGVKIKKEKEKEFKDLNNEKWARDFELEVTNTGDKPIYRFYLLLTLDVKNSLGQDVLAPVYYGRTELSDLRIRATPDDVPLNPGESVVLKLHPGMLDAWDILKRRENWPRPKKLKIELIGLSFGDRTGYMGNDGTLLPHKRNDQSNLNRGWPLPNRSGPSLLDWRGASNSSAKVEASHLPASVLPVNFFYQRLKSAIPSKRILSQTIVVPAGVHH